jgi:hypothetical protein
MSWDSDKFGYAGLGVEAPLPGPPRPCAWGVHSPPEKARGVHAGDAAKLTGEVESSKMLEGASQIVSTIRVICNGT